MAGQPDWCRECQQLTNGEMIKLLREAADTLEASTQARRINEDELPEMPKAVYDALFPHSWVNVVRYFPSWSLAFIEAAEAALTEARQAREAAEGCDGNCSCAVFKSRHEAAMALYRKMDELATLTAERDAAQQATELFVTHSAGQHPYTPTPPGMTRVYVRHADGTTSEEFWPISRAALAPASPEGE